LIPGSSDGTLCAAIALADECGRKFASLEKHFHSRCTVWVGPFQVAEMGQKSVGLDIPARAQGIEDKSIHKIAESQTEPELEKHYRTIPPSPYQRPVGMRVRRVPEARETRQARLSL
jgi:hypothetical protein